MSGRNDDGRSKRSFGGISKTASSDDCSSGAKKTGCMESSDKGSEERRPETAQTEAATICRKYTHEVIEGKGTDHEYTHPSCEGCPFNVEKFGEHKICGCILGAPDDWDEPKVIGHIVRTIIHEMAGGKK